MAKGHLNESSVRLAAPVGSVLITTKLPYVPVAPNATLPPEQYRFIPGSTPTFVNGTVITGTRFKDTAFNATGYYYLEDGEMESGPNEIQTLFLACFATLIPLVIILATGFTIRILWKRYKTRRQCIDFDGVIQRDTIVESCNRPLHSHLLNGDKLANNTQISTEELCDGDALNGIRTTTATITSSSASRKPATANGSIITMTLKNNHLIVETEERNDIEQNRRETTMRYSPSACADVFVVEVSQGGTRSSFASVSQATASTPCDLDVVDLEGSTPVPAATCTHTGLSQSTQSLTSNSYAYSTQHEYEGGDRGYARYTGCGDSSSITCAMALRDEGSCKPRITSAIYKQQHDSFDDLIADRSVADAPPLEINGN